MIGVVDYIVFSLMGVGVFFSFRRFFKGPKLGDRVVGLDTMNMIVIGLIVILSKVFESSLYLDIAIVYGILAFLETIVFARYLEGKDNGNN